jgi:hypothetical protein
MLDSAPLPRRTGGPAPAKSQTLRGSGVIWRGPELDKDGGGGQDRFSLLSTKECG